MVSIFVGLSEIHGGEFDQVKAAFNKCTRYNDGKIRIKELQELFNSKNNWKQIVSNCDLDGDNALDFHEFVVAGMDHHAILTEQNLKRVFSIFDSNKDGEINIEEFINSMPKSLPIDQGEVMGRSNTTYSDTSKQTDEARWNQIIKTVDLNQNGKVDPKEF